MMRPSTILAVLSAATGHGQPIESTADKSPGVPKVTYTERITDKQLGALQEVKPLTKSAPRVIAQRPCDIMEMSDFIAFDEFSTLVPKGAILHIPANLHPNVVRKPKGQLLLWNEFLNRNRARLTPLEINVKEAAGAKAVDEATLSRAIRSGMIVVAVIHGNPTSVYHPVAPTPTTAKH